MILLKQKSRPSYGEGFARSASESANPSLWKNIMCAFAPSLGVTGNVLRNTTNSNKRGVIGTLSTQASTIPTWSIDGGKRVLNYDGSSSYVNMGDNFNPSTKLTLMVFFNNTAAVVTDTIVAKYIGSNRQYRIFFQSTGELRSTVSDDATGTNEAYRISNTTFVTNQWYQTAFVYDGNAGTLDNYTNGVLDNGTLVAPGGVPSSLHVGPQEFRIGVNANYNSFFGGYIGDVFLWERVLSPNEILQLHTDPYALFRLRSGLIMKAPAVPPSTKQYVIPGFGSVDEKNEGEQWLIPAFGYTNEEAAGLAALIVSVSDAIGLVEDIQKLTKNFIGVNDAVALVENIGINTVNNISVFDLITLTENIGINTVNNISVFDLITVTENIQKHLINNINVNDSIALTEDIEKLTTNFIDVNDSVALTENIERSTTNFISVNDLVAIAENININTVNNINVFDIIAVAENININTVNNIHVNDSISITEDIESSTTNFINVFDLITVAESIGINAGGISNLVISVIDSIALTEDIEKLTTNFIDVNDAVALTENIQKHTTNFISVEDYVALTENININTVNHISVSDSVALAENININTVNNIHVNDSVALTEDIQKHTINYISVSDSVILSEDVDVGGFDVIIIINDDDPEKNIDVYINQQRLKDGKITQAENATVMIVQVKEDVASIRKFNF